MGAPRLVFDEAGRGMAYYASGRVAACCTAKTSYSSCFYFYRDDKKNTPLTPNALSEDDLAQGFGPVPFPVYRLSPGGGTDTEPDDGADTSSTAELDNLLQPLGIKREDYKTAGEAFVTGEGSRCRSNSDIRALGLIGLEEAAQIDVTLGLLSLGLL